ncbi:MAG TPA: ABC transporter permease [Chloroflexota bacterium]|nr:ABC transporter permease [Chloroflexota bacterium]
MALVRSSPRTRRQAGSRVSSRARRAVTSVLSPVLTAAIVLLGWELIIRIGKYQVFVLPRPGQVWTRARELLADGTLVTNAWTTLQEAGIGFAIAFVIALPLGYLLAHVPVLERLVAPIIAASQAVPIIALAPLLYLWLSNGMMPKIAASALVVVFPLLVTTITGIRGVPKEYHEVARVFGAYWWERVFLVEAPLAAPVLLGGIKLGFTLSLTGAVVGEFLGADQGLGFLLNYYQENLDTPALFATLLTLGVIGITLYSFVSLLERMVSTWQE